MKAESRPAPQTVVTVVTDAAAAHAPAANVPAAPAPITNVPTAHAPVAAATDHPAFAAPAEASPTVAQRAVPAEAPTSFAQAQPSQAAAPSARPQASCPGNPNALGVSRTVEIDTSGGPGFGFEHFKQHDFLEPGEVVLTYDDGPWPHRTLAVVNALAA